MVQPAREAEPQCPPPYRAEPWEHVLGFTVGVWALNKMSDMEALYEVKVAEKLAEKIERNQGELDEKYKVVLGADYAKWFPSKA